MRTRDFHAASTGWPARYLILVWMVLACTTLPGTQSANSQTFDSGSTGADGALTLTTPGTIVFDPRTFDPPLDPDNDGIYHFTTITIAAGVTVRLSARQVNAPVVWLASGAVEIHGVMNLNGEDGQGPDPIGVVAPAVPGSGGYAGGFKNRPGSGPFGGFARLNPAGGEDQEMASSCRCLGGLAVAVSGIMARVEQGEARC